MFWTFVKWITSWNNDASQTKEDKLNSEQNNVPVPLNEYLLNNPEKSKRSKQISRSKPIKIKQSYKISSMNDRYQMKKKLKKEKNIESNVYMHDECIFPMD